ncbi:MAG: T9SS type A sorting domain-containing protein, partial [Candidatus Marinimicrobia bacterium]|nr:T9SS type A sorting domain-containing protein [Candidatus Neomarinimicrobiota bacterium]
VTTGELVLSGFTVTSDTTIKLAHQDLANDLAAAGMASLTGTWTILARDGTDSTFADGPFTLTLDGSTLANDPDDRLPVQFALHQNYPNPFNPSTSLRFDLPVASDVTLIVYDLLGREVVRLVDRQLEPGYHRVIWNGKTATGRDVPSGLYIALMTTPVFTKSIKLVLLK